MKVNNNLKFSPLNKSSITLAELLKITVISGQNKATETTLKAIPDTIKATLEHFNFFASESQ